MTTYKAINKPLDPSLFNKVLKDLGFESQLKAPGYGGRFSAKQPSVEPSVSDDCVVKPS